MAWVPRLLGAKGATSDEEAMRAVQARGDHDAFARLVDRWQPPIRRLCIRMTGDEHRGEDLAQEAFTRVYANRQRFDATRRFSTWLWRIALNLCHEEARRIGRRGERMVGDVDANGDAARDGAPTPPEQAVRRERVGLVRQALASLPEMYRVVVVLRQYECLKFREIAEVLDLPEGTVKWRMAEALTHLRRSLRPIGDDAAPATSATATASATDPNIPSSSKGSMKERLLL